MKALPKMYFAMPCHGLDYTEPEIKFGHVYKLVVDATDMKIGYASKKTLLRIFGKENIRFSGSSTICPQCGEEEVKDVESYKAQEKS